MHGLLITMKTLGHEVMGPCLFTSALLLTRCWKEANYFDLKASNMLLVMETHSHIFAEALYSSLLTRVNALSWFSNIISEIEIDLGLIELLDCLRQRAAYTVFQEENICREQLLVPSAKTYMEPIFWEQFHYCCYDCRSSCNLLDYYTQWGFVQ